MKNKKNLAAILGIVLLLAIAYVVPMGITVLEDKYLQSKTKNFEIDEIKLYSDETSLIDKLSAFQELLVNKFVMQQSMLELQSESSVDVQAIEQIVLDFLSLLSDKENLSFEKFSVTSIVMADAEGEKVYSLWRCYAADENGNGSLFWIDEATETVLAFTVSDVIVQIGEELTKDNGRQMEAEDVYCVAEALAKYYGFYDVEVVENGRNTAVIDFRNDAENEEVALMLYKNEGMISFNMYPGEVTVSNTGIADN